MIISFILLNISVEAQIKPIAHNVCSFLDPIHGHTGTLQLDARACDDPARGWSQEVAAESAAEEDVRSLGDVPDEEMEAYDDFDELKKKDDSSTTNWFKCGDYE